MQTFLFAAIIVFGSASYAIGIWQMLKNQYAPSTFSRVIWVLLAINSFAGVFFGNGSQSSILLGAILLLGNIAVCIVSFWKGVTKIGTLEYVCIALLLISGFIWILFDAPTMNLLISLVAHFIGALPTYRKVWLNPQSESTAFWSLFFLASVLSIFARDNDSLKAIILPMYYSFFDGSLFALSLRKKLNKKLQPQRL